MGARSCRARTFSRCCSTRSGWSRMLYGGSPPWALGNVRAIRRLSMEFALLAAIAGLLALLLTAIQRRRKESAIQMLLGTFGAAQAEAQRDARQLLVWQPL